MKLRCAALTAALALFGAASAFADEAKLAQTAASPTVISNDPLSMLIKKSLTKPNGGIRSFTATANDKTIELIPFAGDPLQPLKPAAGLVNKTEKIKVESKTKGHAKALPQLKDVADKKASL